MYLEERVEQLENLSVDQGKQIEIIAKGLATITIDMQKGFADVRQQQNKMYKELTEVKKDISDVKADLSGLKSDVKADLSNLKADVKADVNSMNTDLTTFRAEVNNKFKAIDDKFEAMDERFDRMDKKLDQRFDDIVALIKSK